MTRTKSVLEYSAFEKLRNALLEEGDPRRLDRPLAMWAKPGDGSLPLALMDLSLRSIVSTPFEKLCEIRTIGPKKTQCFLRLLQRAAAIPEQPPTQQLIEPSTTNGMGNADLRTLALQETEQANSVTAELWDTWRETVKRHRLGDLHLGQLVRSLQELPSTAWNRQIGEFAQLSLDQLRTTRVFGKKRVSTVLEVFATLHSMLAGFDTPLYLSITMTPPLVAKVDRWITSELDRPVLPKIDELWSSFMGPLIEQLEIDGGQHLAAMVRNHLEWPEPEPSRDGADEGRRADLYLHSHFRRRVAAIMYTRWSAGPRSVRLLFQRYQHEHEDCMSTTFAPFCRAAQLFFPSSTRVATPPLHASAKQPPGVLAVG